MSEEYLLIFLARARGSKGGLLFLALGVLILFAFLVFGVVSVVGDIIFLVTGTGPIIDFLGTGWGVLIGLVVAVIIILLGLAFLIRATPQSASTSDGSQSSSPSDASTPVTQPQTTPEEIEHFRTKLSEVEQERDSLKKTVEQQQERLCRYDGDRDMLKDLLTEARSKGGRLRENNPTWEAADEWASTVSDLIKDAFGKTPVKAFMDDKDDRLAADRHASREQNWIDNRLNQLDKLKQQLEHRNGVPFRTGFDPHNYDPDTLVHKERQLENQKLSKENENLKKAVGSYAETAKYWTNRRLLKTALGEVYKHGLFWKGHEPTDTNLKNWTERTHALIKASVGEEQADLFLEDQQMPGMPDKTEANRWMDQRLQRLADLMQRVDSLRPLELQTDFNGHEWVSKR